MWQIELDTRDHPAPAVVLVVSQLECYVQLYFGSCVHKRVCSIFTHLNSSQLI